MLTPQEVEERVFPKAKKGGYDMQDVDNFLDQLTADYTELYKENAVLKRKMKVLADKITEYQETEGAMRATLLTAQKMANQLVEEAKAWLLYTSSGPLPRRPGLRRRTRPRRTPRTPRPGGWRERCCTPMPSWSGGTRSGLLTSTPPTSG